MGQLGRLMLVPFTLALLAAACVPLLVAMLSGGAALQTLLADAALQARLSSSLMEAAVLACAALPLGLLGSLALWRQPGWARGLVAAYAVLVVMAPAPPLPAAALLMPPQSLATPGWLGLGCALARGIAVCLLCLGAFLRRIDPGLLRSARAAGASGARALRDAVLLPLLLPSVLAWLAGFGSVLVQSAFAASLAPHLRLAALWVLPSCLLLAGLCAAATASLIGQSAARAE